MKILSSSQLKWVDEYTIENEPISSSDLLIRASSVFVNAVVTYLNSEVPVTIFCGTGNNGGDGFAIAKLLQEYNFDVRIYLVPFGEMTEDCRTQFSQVAPQVTICADETVLELNETSQVIDALLGIGSNREPEGLLASIIRTINASKAQVYAVDMPSGLSADEIPKYSTIVKATHTFTFQLPKLSFLMPETSQFLGDWEVLNIGLDEGEIERIRSKFQVLQSKEITDLIKVRKRFSHKGTYGHGLLIAGSKGKMGAAQLSARAALRSGLGLLTVHVPKCGQDILQIGVPEAMCSTDDQSDFVSVIHGDLTAYSAIGIGPGLGKHEESLNLLKHVIRVNKPTVFDADALNLMADHPFLLEQLPYNSVLTPHPKEFERIVGTSSDSIDRLERLSHFAQMYKCTVVLKDAITTVASKTGEISFNLTGNPGMATGGSGDVLTGIILGLLTQGYTPLEAAQIGVFHHGKAGDRAKKRKGENGLIASDLIDFLKIKK